MPKLTKEKIEAIQDSLLSDSTKVIRYLKEQQPSKRMRMLMLVERITLWIFALAGVVLALIALFR